MLTAYNAYIIANLGIPENLSITYYRFQQWQRKSWLFPAFIITICIILAPVWLYISVHLSELSRRCTFLIPIAAVALLIVALLSRYRETKLRCVLHYIFAILAVICSALWIFIVCYTLFYVPILILCTGVLIAFVTRTQYSCIIFWLEQVTLYSVFITLLLIV